MTTQKSKIKVVINGALGKMGCAAVKAVNNHPELMLAGALDRSHNLGEELKEIAPDVVVDFTDASAGVRNTRTILEAGCRPVIGTSGFTEHEVSQLQALALKHKIGGVIAPNFALGSVLLMKYSSEVARFFPNVEIVETHHEKKKDAPSGTALKTAEGIALTRGERAATPLSPSQSTDLIPGAQGATHHGIKIHSIRLPGHLAHQEVIFGGTGEVVTLRHDVLDRECYMPGVCMACMEVVKINYLAYGLENLLFDE
jgi:4-hydroxy-tetrahydrodipicolinate reductase